MRTGLCDVPYGRKGITARPAVWGEGVRTASPHLSQQSVLLVEGVAGDEHVAVA
jgi:hypothetical protein